MDKKNKTLIKKWLTILILTGGAIFLGTSIFIGVYGNIDNADFYEDAVIVLGAGLRGENVSNILAYRLDAAVEYSLNNPNALIIVSGGLGQNAEITEALAMERYLIAQGIPKEKIIKEELSTSTFENLLFSKHILDALFEEPYRIVIITSNFHIFRASRLAARLELDAGHIGARINLRSVPANFSREFAAILWMIFFS